jgi:hypothetical protein
LRRPQGDFRDPDLDLLVLGLKAQEFLRHGKSFGGHKADARPGGNTGSAARAGEEAMTEAMARTRTMVFMNPD